MLLTMDWRYDMTRASIATVPRNAPGRPARPVIAEGMDEAMKRILASCVIGAGLALSLSACTSPYDPAQRALGGGLIGAGAGAAIGAAAGGGPGAALGAAIGGAVGVVGGVVTTPPPPGYYGYGGYYPYPGYANYGYPGYYGPPYAYPSYYPYPRAP
jgi:hypothetical protein